METRKATATPKPTKGAQHYLPGLYRKSGNLVNQQLHNATNLEPEGIQFGLLSQDTQDKIRQAGVLKGTDQEVIVQGIDLTASEAKLVNTFCKLLQRESTEVYNPNLPGFYCGNRPPKETHIGKAPQLCVPTTDLVVEYTGNQHPSGPEYKQVEALVDALSTKRFLLKFSEVDYYEKDNTKHVRWIETYATLVSKVTVGERVEQGGKEIESNEVTKLVLNPIFRADIGTRFIMIPCNLEQQIKEAYKGQRVPKGAIDFAEWMLREMSNKRYKCELGQDKLLVMIAKPKVKGRKIAEAHTLVTKCLEVMRSIGLLVSWEISNNILGKTKYTFYLNEGYIKAD